MPRTTARRALLVGINNYVNFDSLESCVADVESMAAVLSRHVDGKPNYDCKKLVADGDEQVKRAQLRTVCRELFAYDGDVLLYFSGHGVITDTGGLLATSDAEEDDYGLPLDEIVQMANSSRANNILVIIDSCHSGNIGDSANLNRYNSDHTLMSALRENMIIIAAAKGDEVALEAGGNGIFTAALVEALEGGAADHMGWVTAANLYNYVERRFSSWAQRPVYKAYTTLQPVVRECAPLIERLKLAELTTLFPTYDYKFSLDPEFDPEDENGNFPETVDEEKLRISRLFKDYRDAGLLRPTEIGEQLFWTARRSHTVELTARGREYWGLVKKGII
jgi:hypothetical protein